MSTGLIVVPVPGELVADADSTVTAASYEGGASPSSLSCPATSRSNSSGVLCSCPGPGPLSCAGPFKFTVAGLVGSALRLERELVDWSDTLTTDEG